MPSEKALEYTVTNTDFRPSPKYRITSTYIADPSRNALLIRTRFESLDGGVYRLYLLDESKHGGRRRKQRRVVGRNELGADGKWDANPVRRAHDGRFGAQGRKSERLCRE